MPRTTKYYTIFDRKKRDKLEALYNANIPVKRIAEELGYSYQSIYRELKRGYYMHRNYDCTETKRYSADKAQKAADAKTAAKGAPLKLDDDKEFVTFVEDMILQGYSPEAILLYIKEHDLNFKTKVGRVTLYSYIEKGLFPRISNFNLIRKGVMDINNESLIEKDGKFSDKIMSLMRSLFASKGIEFFSILSYADQKETSKSIMARAGFTPKSVIVFLVPYYTGESVNLSRYATSFDYHILLRGITDSLIVELKKKYPNHSFRGYGDNSPIDERYAALIGGLGIAGDSGLIINEKYGTYTFIGEIVTDIPPQRIGALPPKPIETCHHCGACKRACPTGILRAEGSDCLSAITQRKGELSEEEVALMRKCNTVWGCDLCQVSCPYNRDPKITPIEFFHKERIPLLTSELLAGMDKQSFKLRAFAWRGRKTVERNLELLGY